MVRFLNIMSVLLRLFLWLGIAFALWRFFDCRAQASRILESANSLLLDRTIDPASSAPGAYGIAAGSLLVYRALVIIFGFVLLLRRPGGLLPSDNNNMKTWEALIRFVESMLVYLVWIVVIWF